MKPYTKFLFAFIGVSITIAISSCSKDATTFDYSNIKIKQSTTNNGSNTDTVRYFYNGENVQTVTNYSYNPTFFYTYNFTKNGNKYDYSTIYGTTNTHEGFLNLNAQGLIDTARTTNIITTNFNNRDRHYYNTDGYSIRSITLYNGYQNDYRRYYNAAGDYTYWIYDYTDLVNPGDSYRDSTTFEYYEDELHVAFEYALQEKYGKLNKHLVKKKYNFNSTTDALKSITEYQYELDSKGLVTRRIVKIFEQPGNVLISTRISDYTYYE